MNQSSLISSSPNKPTAAAEMSTTTTTAAAAATAAVTTPTTTTATTISTITNTNELNEDPFFSSLRALKALIQSPKSITKTKSKTATPTSTTTTATTAKNISTPNNSKKNKAIVTSPSLPIDNTLPNTASTGPKNTTPTTTTTLNKTNENSHCTSRIDEINDKSNHYVQLQHTSSATSCTTQGDSTTSSTSNNNDKNQHDPNDEIQIKLKDAMDTIQYEKSLRIRMEHEKDILQHEYNTLLQQQKYNNNNNETISVMNTTTQNNNNNITTNNTTIETNNHTDENNNNNNNIDPLVYETPIKKRKRDDISHDNTTQNDNNNDDVSSVLNNNNNNNDIIIHTLQTKLNYAVASIEKEKQRRIEIENERDSILQECYQTQLSLFNSPLTLTPIMKRTNQNTTNNTDTDTLSLYNKIYQLKKNLQQQITLRIQERKKHLKDIDQLQLQLQAMKSQRDTMAAKLHGLQQQHQQIQQQNQPPP